MGLNRGEALDKALSAHSKNDQANAKIGRRKSGHVCRRCNAPLRTGSEEKFCQLCVASAYTRVQMFTPTLLAIKEIKQLAMKTLRHEAREAKRMTK